MTSQREPEPEPESEYAFVIGLVPYVVLDDGGIQSYECMQCSTVRATRHDTTFGIGFTIGLTHLP